MNEMYDDDGCSMEEMDSQCEPDGGTDGWNDGCVGICMARGETLRMSLWGSNMPTVQEEGIFDCDNFDDDTFDEFNDRFYACQISKKEFDKQTSDYTKQAVDALIKSPEYQRRHKSCQSCWSQWLDGQSRLDCFECGGFALDRSCPICLGKCGSLWKRNVDMSHTHHEAHWDGKCQLSEEEQQVYMLQNMTDATDASVTDAMNDLTVGTWS